MKSVSTKIIWPCFFIKGLITLFLMIGVLTWSNHIKAQEKNTQQAAVPSVNETIGNVATIKFKVGNQNAVETQKSNVAITTIQQIYKLNLSVAENRKGAIPGKSIDFSYTLKNIGNGTDSFNIKLKEEKPDGVKSLEVFAENNAGPGAIGIAISEKNEYNIQSLKRSDSVNFIVRVTLDDISFTESKAITIVATSKNDEKSEEKSTLTIRPLAELEGFFDISPGKALDSVERNSEQTVIFSIKNRSTTQKPIYIELAQTDGTAFSYISESLKIMEMGMTSPINIDTSKLTELNKSKAQLIGDISKAEKFVMAFNMDADKEIEISFGVKVPEVAKGGDTYLFHALYDTAKIDSISPTMLVENGSTPTINSALTKSNPFKLSVKYDVIADIELRAKAIDKALAGTTITWPVTLKNNSSQAQTFHLIRGNDNFPAGTTFSFLDNLEHLLPDTTQTGMPDTGLVAAGDTKIFVVQAKLPKGELNSSTQQYGALIKVIADTNNALTKSLNLELKEIQIGKVEVKSELVERSDNVLRLTISNKNPSDDAEKYALSFSASSTGYSNNGLATLYRSKVGGMCETKDFKQINVINSTDLIVPEQSQVICAVFNLNNQPLKMNFEVKGQLSGAIFKSSPYYFNKKSTLHFESAYQDITLAADVTHIEKLLLLNTGGAIKEGDYLVKIKSNHLPNGSVALVFAVEDDIEYNAITHNLFEKENKLPVIKQGNPISATSIFVKIIISPNAAPNQRPYPIEIALLSKDQQVIATTSINVTITDKAMPDLAIQKKQAIVDKTANACMSPPDASAFSIQEQNIKPGQCVWYQTTVENKIAESVQDIVIFDPIPQYTKLIEASQKAYLIKTNHTGNQLINDVKIKIQDTSIKTEKVILAAKEIVILQYAVEFKTDMNTINR